MIRFIKYVWYKIEVPLAVIVVLLTAWCYLTGRMSCVAGW